jgi:hypothetical protein
VAVGRGEEKICAGKRKIPGEFSFSHTVLKAREPDK